MISRLLAGALAVGACSLASVSVAENGFSDPSGPNSRCDTITFRVYFDPKSTTLNEEAEELTAMALHDAGGCGALDVSFAADPRLIDVGHERRATSERSVAILEALRTRGFSGDVFITEVSDVVVAAEQNVGPHYIEVSLSPRHGSSLVANAQPLLR